MTGVCGYESRKIEDRKCPKFDRDKIMYAVKMFIEGLGDDPLRDGLQETPERVARMCEEVFEGMLFRNEDIARMFGTCFKQNTNDLVVVSHIPIFSYCEHHLALMYNMEVAVGYIPRGKVIGLSKLARIAEMCGKRLQLQERLGNDIAEVVEMVTGSEDVIVVVQGEHSCMTTRGIKSRGSRTKTAALRGAFKTDASLRNEFYKLAE